MKAKLEFTLPEERSEFRAAMRADQMTCEITDADNQMRSWLKHGHPFKSATAAIEACRLLLLEVTNKINNDETTP